MRGSSSSNNGVDSHVAPTGAVLHVVANVNMSTPTANELWINGAKVLTGWANAAPSGVAPSMVMGNTNGLVSKVALYNRFLTSAEIAADYAYAN